MQARPISTNLGSTEEACEYGLTRGTCFVARRLEVVAVAGLLWIYFVACFEWWDFVFFFVFFTSNAHGLLQACMRSTCLIYLSTSNEAVLCL